MELIKRILKAIVFIAEEVIDFVISPFVTLTKAARIGAPATVVTVASIGVLFRLVVLYSLITGATGGLYPLASYWLKLSVIRYLVTTIFGVVLALNGKEPDEAYEFSVDTRFVN